MGLSLTAKDSAQSCDIKGNCCGNDCIEPDVREQCEDQHSGNGKMVQPKDHVEDEGSLGIYEMFDSEERKVEIGNFVIDRVIATTLTGVPVVVEGQEVKAVLDHGVDIEDGNTREEIPKERLEWRPAASNWELMAAGHDLRKGGTMDLHMDTCDKDITENLITVSAVEDLSLACGIEEKDITEETRKGTESGTKEIFWAYRLLDEDMQSFSGILMMNDIRGIEEDEAERGLVTRGIDVLVESDDVLEELKKIDRIEGNGADISIPGHLGDVCKRFESRQRTRNKELDEILRKHIRWR